MVHAAAAKHTEEGAVAANRLATPLLPCLHRYLLGAPILCIKTAI